MAVLRGAFRRTRSVGLGEFEPYFKNYVMNSRFGVTEESYLFDFRDTGKLPNLGTGDAAGVWNGADGRRNFPDGRTGAGCAF